MSEIDRAVQGVVGGDLKWYAAGGGLSRIGPFNTQVEGWEAMEYTPDFQERTRLKHPLIPGCGQSAIGDSD